jgi:hypothetical protein
MLGMAHSMLKSMSMPSYFWGDAMITAVFILNRSSTQSMEGKTPYEVWHGEKPSMHYLRTFGCVVQVKQGSKHLGKLEDHSTMMVFIGMSLAPRHGDSTIRQHGTFTRPVTRSLKKIAHGTRVKKRLGTVNHSGWSMS